MTTTQRKIDRILEKQRKKDRDYLYIEKVVSIRMLMLFLLCGLVLGIGFNSIGTAEDIRLHGYAVSPSWCYKPWNETRSDFSTLCPLFEDCDVMCELKYNATEFCAEKQRCYQGVINCRQYVFERCKV